MRSQKQAAAVFGEFSTPRALGATSKAAHISPLHTRRHRRGLVAREFARVRKK